MYLGPPSLRSLVIKVGMLFICASHPLNAFKFKSFIAVVAAATNFGSGNDLVGVVDASGAGPKGVGISTVVRGII